jgi:hypothetical protein
VAQAGVETWLQCDGNLVTYHSNGSLPWWNSGTAGVGAGAYSLELHKGGYLTISDATGVYIWQSNYSAMVDSDDFQGRFNQLVSRNKQFMAYISPAGALEVRHNMTGLSYSSLSTQSFGKLSETGASGITSGPFYGRIQSDGNLVVYSSMGSSVWSSATTSSAVSVSLLLTDTGKLVIISHDQDGDRDIWRSIPDQSDVLKALETRYIESRNGAYYFAVNPTGVFGMYRTSTGDMLWGNSTPFDSSAKTNYEFKILGREYGYVFALNPIGQSVIWFEAGQNSLTGLVPAGNVGKGVFTKTFDPLVGLSEPLYFKVENDGRLVKYDSTGTAVWTTG